MLSFLAHISDARQQQKNIGCKSVIKTVNERAATTPISTPSTQAAGLIHAAQICLAITLLVAYAEPTFSAARPQNQEQSAGFSQTATKSMSTYDPCASFLKSVQAVTDDALSEKSRNDGDVNPASQVSQTRVKVTISPQTDIRLAVGYSLRLAATVTGASITAVEWAVAGPGCSGPACGSIVGEVYLAPAAIPNPPIVRLTATSKADSRASNSTIVCLVQPGHTWRNISAAKIISAAALQSAVNISAIVGRNDTADLKPYVEVLQEKVQEKWYERVPQSARGPELKQGHVTVEFSIERSGKITDATIASTSGDTDLDKAALTAIRKAKLPPFPITIHGDHLTLRINFEYNPSRPL
jgi:TonB family protein